MNGYFKSALCNFDDDEERENHPVNPCAGIQNCTCSTSSSSSTTSSTYSLATSVTTTTITYQSATSISSTATPTPPHTFVILGSVLGVVAFISLLLFLLFLFLRRRKRQRSNADRESQIPEPYCQEKVPCTTTRSGTSQCQDQGEVLRVRARVGELEETVQQLLNDRNQHSMMGSEVDPQPPPDYASASSGADGHLHVFGIS